jgi:hypothetical protein
LCKHKIFLSFGKNIFIRAADAFSKNLLENDIDMLKETSDVEINDNITDESVEGNVDPEMTFELGSKMINEIICELRCKTSLTHAMLSVVVNMMMKISLIISSYIKSQVKCFLRCFSVDLNCPQVVLNLLNLCDVSAFFLNIDISRKQLKFNFEDYSLSASRRNYFILRNRTPRRLSAAVLDT